MDKTLLFILSILITMPAMAQNGIVDEVDTGEISDSSIMNRNMKQIDNLNSTQGAFDNSKPNDNVRIVTYKKEYTYKIRLREFMETTFILPSGEVIASYILGDPAVFKFMHMKGGAYQLDNVFTIKPIYPGADTNLTIIGTSGRVYSFYLRSDSVDSKYVPDLVVYVQSGNEETPTAMPPLTKNEMNIGQGTLNTEAGEYLKTLPQVKLENINYQYKYISGDMSLKPLKIFDDGYWTYFIFDDVNKPGTLPVVYRVVDGYDTPVNTRLVGNMLIAETVSKGWTLRAGEKHLCVRAYKDGK